ncbi:MAG: DUF1501 domain-containing protein [Planctomycetaceae bacterium]|nr:DUF1501 domain-containing protein [Planctomycetaceae bacterium]
MPNRRRFLQTTSLLSLTPVLPAFLPRTAMALDAERDERILVVLQMSGGNDGLNTVIPYADESYSKYRSQLQIPTDDVIRLNDSLGLHPAMKAASELLDDGRLAIVNGVGYPNPDRSHFRSMAIWHSARLNSEDHNGHGWLGRAVDSTRATPSSSADAIFVGDGNIPAAIVGRRATPIALNNEKELMLAAELATPKSSESSDDLTAFIQQTVATSFSAARQFNSSKTTETQEDSTYPDTALGQKMKLMAKMIRLNTGTRIFYVEQPGYDTHSSQKFTHERLLRQFSTSLKAFLDDMKAGGFGDRVTVLAFSEFGRRVQENASAGTDHGTSGPVFVAGESVNAGLHGTYPLLADLEDGDLKSTTDFRTIYSALLTDWLRIDSLRSLGKDFPRFPVFRSV